MDTTLHRTLLLTILLLAGFTTTVGAVDQTWNTTYNWNNALDHSGVTWDTIQDHPDHAATQGYQYGSLTEGLVGYWDFEAKTPQGPRDAALDNNGTMNGDNDGTLNNFEFNSEAGWTSGKEGTTVQFDGVEGGGQNRHVEISSSDELNITDTITISAWVRYAGTEDCTNCEWPRVLAKGRNEAYEIWSSKYNNYLRINTRLYIDGTDQGFSGQRKLWAGRWYHLTYTFNTTHHRMYWNGELERNKQVSGSIDTTANPLAIGNWYTTNREWTGKIDEVRLYDRTLSSSEISDLYNGNPVNRSGLVGEWTFDEGQGTTAHDTSNWGNGKLGRYSGEFDGLDDDVEVSDEKSLNGKGDLTLSAWIKPEDMSTRSYILARNDQCTNIRHWAPYELRVTSGAKLQYQVSETHDCDGGHSWDTYESDSSLSTDTWQHVAATVINNDQETREVDLFLNGERLSISQTQDYGTGDAFDGSDYSIFIGARSRQSGDRELFNGSIDSARIYDRALSVQEVKALYNRDTREQRIGSQDTLQSGLVGWWPLHETSGNTTDLSGNDNDGEAYGVTQGVAGRGGVTAYDFDGSNGYVNLTEFSGVPGSTDKAPRNDPHTLSAWVKADTANQDSAVVGKFDEDRGSNHWERYGDGIKYVDGKLMAFFRQDSDNPRLNYSLDTPTAWHHVAVIGYTPEGELWVDGKLREEGNLSQDYGYDFAIGAEVYERSATQHFDGKIQDVRVYNRALSNSEIQRLYRMGSGDYATPPGDSEGGVAYWSFDHNLTGRTVVDEFGNYDGVLGTQSGSNHPRYTTNATRGTALSFDGDDDYVELSNTSVFRFTSNFTVSTWVKPDILENEHHGIVGWPDVDNWLIYTWGNGLIVRYENQAGNQQTVNPTGADVKNASRWQHITIGYDNTTNDWLYYINGVHEATGSETGGIGDAGWSTPAIGTYNIAGGDQSWEGEIDEMRIYNRLLRDHEVHEIYQQGTFGRDLRPLTTQGGLVGYWSLDEDSGQFVYDLSGQGNNATTRNFDGDEQGAQGILSTSSYRLDGSNDYLRLDDDPSLDINGEITVSAWAKFSDVSTTQSIISKGQNVDSGNINYRLGIGHEATSTLDFGYYDGGWARAGSGGSALQNGKWYHLVGVYDGNSYITYVNGKQDDSLQSSSAPVEDNNWLAIGQSSEASQYVDGKIDEVRIYNRSLTPAEIQSLYSTSQRGELLTRANFGGPARPDLYSLDYQRNNQNISVEVYGSHNTDDQEREDVFVHDVDTWENGPAMHNLSWDQPHEVFHTRFETNTSNVTGATTFGGFGLNMSGYEPSAWAQFRHGFGNSIDTDSEPGEIRLGRGNWSDESLVAHYSFEPKQPGNVTDVSRSGNTGTFHNNEKDGSLDNFDFDPDSGWINGKRGRHALQFDGSDDHVDVGAVDDYNITSGSFSAWIRADGGQEPWARIVSLHLTGADRLEMWIDRGSQDGTVELYAEHEDSSVISLNTQETVEDRQWHHVAGAWDQNGAELYLDGVQVASSTGDKRVAFPNLPDARIGARDGPNRFFNGSIDDVRMYNRSLTASQVSDLYQGTADPRRGLVGEWTFDEGSGTTAHDTSKWTSGVRQGKGLEFDGQDDRVEVSHSSSLNLSEEVTVAAWVRLELDGGDGRAILGKPGAYGIHRWDNSIFGDVFVEGTRENPEMNGDAQIGRWYHAVVTYDGRAVDFFLDGKIQDSHPTTGQIDTNSNAFNIADDFVYDDDFNGSVDDVRIYSRALTPYEISHLYNPQPGYWSSSFMDAGSPTVFTNLTWTEDLQQSTDVEGRVQVADQVNTTRDQADWDAGTSSIAAHDNLVGYWRFEDSSVDGSGGTVQDWSGQRNDGTANNGVDTQATGFRPQSNAYSFDGEDDRVSTPGLHFSNKTGWSLSAWILHTGDRKYEFWAGKSDTGEGFTLRQSWEDSIEFRDVDKNYHELLNPATEYKGRWTHHTYIADGLGNLTLYLNGQKITTASSVNTTFTLGEIGDGYSSSSWPAEARIDEVRIYNQSLSSQDVRSSYRSMTWTSQWLKWPESHYNGPTPVSRWEFSRGAGQTVEDVEGDNDGTLGSSSSYGSADPTWVSSCRLDGCLSFDGSNDLVEVPDDASLNITGNTISYSFWVKPLSNQPDSDPFIISKGSGGDEFLEAHIQAGNSENYMRFIPTAGETIDTPTGSLQYDQWSHYTLSYDASSNDAQIYENGDPIATSYDGTANTLSPEAFPLHIGERGDGSRPFAGKVDDVRIYNTSLTGEEVRSAMISPKTPYASWQARGGEDLKPLHHWTLDEGTGQEAFDSAGDMTGTLGADGLASGNNDPNWTTDCRYRGCLEFDGSGDTVEVSVSGNRIGNNNSFSYSAWFYADDTSQGQILGSNAGCFEGANLAVDSGNVRFGIRSGSRGTCSALAEGSMTAGTWHHAVGVATPNSPGPANGSTKVYLDGNLMGTDWGWNGTVVDNLADEIGADEATGPEWPFDGKIDDVRIYNRSLSNASIRALYNAPSSTWGSASVQVRTSAANPEDPDLVGSWSFEGVGQTVVDNSQEDNQGTLGDNASITGWDPGRIGGYSGQAVRFDGLNDYVKIGDPQSLDASALKDEITVSVWCKARGSEITDGDDGRCVNKDGDTSGDYILDLNDHDGDNTLEAQWRVHTGSYTDQVGGDIANNTWTHLVGTYDGSQIRLYVDGRLASSGSQSGDLSDSCDTCPVAFGANAGIDVNYLDGAVDEVRIYNRSLSTDEVHELYNLSDFTPASRFNQGSFHDVNTTTGHGTFDSNYLQYKVNLLTGDFGPPTVEQAKVAHASGWTGFATDAGSTNLSLAPARYGQVQVNLSTSAPENSSAVEDITLHTTTDEADLCGAPGDGDWVITRNCTINNAVEAPENVEVRSPHFVNVTADGAIDIDFVNHHLLVDAGAKVLVDALGRLS